MDIFEEYLSPTALLDAFPSVPQFQTLEETSNHAFVFHEISPEAAGTRERIRQKWETLKPLIKRVYIDDNKPYPSIARILREEHQFETTKRKFDRQMAKWGPEFKKNFSHIERQTILQSSLQSMNDVGPEVPRRRPRPARIEAWRRRYREERIDGLSISPQEANSEVVSHTAPNGIFRAEEEFPSAESTLAQSESPLVSTMTETIHDPAEVLRQGSQDILSVDRGQDSWPFDWSDIDIPGSPGLSRLFKGLEVECAHIPTLTLHEPESGDTSCLSASEIQEVLHKKNDATDTPDTPDKSSHQYLSSLIQRHCSSLGRPSRSRQPQYPWRDIKNVYCGYATDPLREIYVFSNSNPENLPRQLSNPRVPVWTDIQVAERELRSKFTHLRMQLPEDSPAVVAVMDNLAFILYEMEDYRQAEVLYRKLVDIYKRTLKGPDIKFLEACQRVIESLRCQGQYSTAKDWNDEIRPTISRLFEPHDALAVRAARNDARLAEDLGSSEESEKLLRELLQITLVVHGPRHQSTIAAISSLGSTMSHRGKEEGHTLLRTAVQLSLERQDELAEIGCWATGELTLILKESDMFEEGYNVATKAVAQFGPLLGQNNRHITTLEQYRAWTMPRIGNMPEREKVFRGLISAYSNSRVESNQDLLMDTWDCLAGVLSQTHRMEEAIYWYEQSFEMRFPQDGANNSRVVDVCYRLANCYERQGRLENALDVYSRMIGKIYDCCKEQYDMIPVFGFEISRIEELVEQWTRCS